MMIQCVGFPSMGTRFGKVITAVGIVAVNVVGLSFANAQWVKKNDVDASVGFPLAYNFVVTAPTHNNYTQPAKVDLIINTSGSYQVILKVYGGSATNSTPLFTKLLPIVTGTQTSRTFSTDLSHPKNQSYQLPIGPITLVADAYHILDGPTRPVPSGYESFYSVLFKNGVEGGSSYPQLWARKHGGASAELGVATYDVFQSRSVSATATVVVTPVYNSNATTAQRRALDAKARTLANSTASSIATVINGFSPAHFPWRATVAVGSPGIRSTASINNRIIAADRANSFLSTVASQAKTQSIPHQEGVLNLYVTTTQSLLN